MQNQKKSPGRVAVVTGAAGALGSAMAERLGEDGFSVTLLDKNEAALDSITKSLTAKGIPVSSVVLDLTNPADVDAAAKTVSSKFGRCDALVNAVGMLTRGVSIENLPVEIWDKIFEVNLRSAFLALRSFGPLMLANTSGSVVNIASTAASQPNSIAPYSVTKAAMVALSRQVAVEWGPRGVRSNAVSPGFVRTPLSEHFYADPDTYKLRVGAVASRKLASVRDIANVVAYLAGDESAYINGQEIIVDGGLLHTGLMRLQPERDRYAAGEAW